MTSDNEMVSLIKGAADESQFDIMSVEEMEIIYRQGLRLVKDRPYDEDLLVAVNQFEFEIKKRGGQLPSASEQWRDSISATDEFTIQKRKPERNIFLRIAFGILWFFPIYLATGMLIGAIVGAISGAATHNVDAAYISGREASASFFHQYGILVLLLQIFLTAALSFYGLLPGTGKYKKSEE